MRRIKQVIQHVDKQVLQAFFLSFCFMAGAAGLVLLLRQLGFGDIAIKEWMQIEVPGIWHLPLAIVIFTVSAFLGVPQFLLIAACVTVFSPWEGGVYAILSTLVSASLGFWLARLLGKTFLPHGGGEGFQRLSGFIGKHGFWASLFVRLVPSAPFIVINMAAGMCQIRYISFFLGTALGILPKTVLIAVFGGSLKALAGGKWMMAGGFFILSIICLLALVLVARFYKRSAKTGNPE